MATLPPPLLAAREVLTPLVQLVLAVVALLLTALLVLFESRLRPTPPRLLSSVVPPPPPPLKRRARALLAVLRLLLAVTVAASLLLTTLPAIRLISGPPLAELADDPVNRWAHALVSRAVLVHAAATEDALLPTRVGVGKRAAAADRESAPKLLWALLLLLVVAVALAGTVAAAVPHRLPAKNAVAVIMFVQALVWLVAAVPAALVRPTRLPLDGAPLLRHWMDREYIREPRDINETRFLANWFAAVPGEDGTEARVVPLADVRGMEDAFCKEFIDLAPKTASEVVVEDSDDATTTPPSTTTVSPTTTAEQVQGDDTDAEQVPPSTAAPSTTVPSGTTGVRPTQRRIHAPVAVRQQEADDDEDNDEDNDEGNDGGDIAAQVPSPDSIEIESLSAERFAEVILVYLVGKPIGRDQYRILSYTALGAMAGAPVVVGQFCNIWLLYPLVAVWAAVSFVIGLLATSSVLRVLTAPREGKQVFSMCGRYYSVLVGDSTTRLIGRLDAAFFAVVLLVGLLQGFRWRRLADRWVVAKAPKEATTVSAEENYTEIGALKW